MLCLNTTDKKCGRSFTIKNEPFLPRKDIIDFWLYGKNSNLLLTSKKFNISLYQLRKLIMETYPNDFETPSGKKAYTYSLKNYVLYKNRISEYKYDGRFDDEDAQKYGDKYGEKCNAIISELKNIIFNENPDSIYYSKDADTLSSSELNKILRFSLKKNASPYNVVTTAKYLYNCENIKQTDSSELSLTELKQLLWLSKPKPKIDRRGKRKPYNYSK